MDDAAETEPGEGAGGEPMDPIERLLDLCLYAPLGFVVDARRVVPDLVQRGRSQAGVARMIGELAVTWGNAKVTEAVSDAQDQALGLLRRVGLASDDREPATGAPSEADADRAAGADVTAPGSDETRSPVTPLVPSDGVPRAESTDDAALEAGDLDEEVTAAWTMPEDTVVPDDEPASTATDGSGDADDADDADDAETESDEAASLGIPDYDNLSASQVVPRLDGLTATELEAVGHYERRHRHRKTILNRVAQLQSGSS